MRNLKKILALVLALMMVLSVMVTASAADYSDAADIQYTEAVEVMSTVGILEGNNGAFSPKGTLDRASAAKIIAYILKGGDLESIESDAMVQPFEDAASSWAADYIAYIASEGIVSGNGVGNYYPRNTLTGYEFAKMLLVTAGIDGEYTGSGWKLAVATAAKTAGLLNGLAADYSLKADITREEAAQMAFNAMNYATDSTYGYAVIDTMGTTGDTTDDTVLGYYPTMIEAATAAAVLGVNYTYSATKTVVTNNSMASSLFALNTFGATYGIGYEGYYWYVDINGNGAYNSTVDVLASSFVCTDTVVGVYTKANSYKEVAADLGKTANFSADVYANGTKTGTTTVTYNSTAKVESDSDVTLTVVVAADTAKTVKLLYARETLTFATRGAKVTDKTSVNYGLYPWTFKSAADGTTVIATVYGAADAYSPYVGYLVVPTAIPTITVAETVVGAVASVATGLYIRVNGSIYYLSDASVSVTANAYAYKTVYLNTAGDVTYVGAYTTAATVYDGYAYLTDVEYIATPYSATGLVGSGSEATITAKAKIVTAGGETLTVDVATDVYPYGSTYYVDYYLNGWNSATTTGLTVDAMAEQTLADQWVAYVVEDGVYYFDTMATTTIANAATKTATVTIDSVKHYMDASTVINFVDYNTDSKAIETTTVTGYTNITALVALALNNTHVAVVDADPTSKVVSSVTIYGTTSTIATVNFAVYAGKLETSGISSAYDTYGFYVNGELNAYYLATGTDVSGLTAGDVVIFDTNAQGKVIDATKVSALSGTYTVYSGVTVGSISADGTYLINAYGNIYTLGTGYVVYDTATNGYAVAELGAGQTVNLIVANGVVVAAFITAHPAE